MTVTRRAIIRMKFMSCSTTMTVAVSLSRRRSRTVFFTSSTVMPAVGSSSRTKVGSPPLAMPISSHCFSPWESHVAGWSARSVRPMTSSISAARRRPPRLPKRNSAATCRFSNTLSSSRTLGTWNLMLIPSRATRNASHPVMSRPRKRTVPASGRMPPLRIRKNVDLPAPLGPIRQRSSPASMVRSRWTARSPPNCFVRPLTSRIGSGMCVLSSEHAEVSLLAGDPVAEIDEDRGQEQPPPPAAVTGEDPEERRRDPVLEHEDDAHEDRALDEQRRLAHDAPASLHQEGDPGSGVGGNGGEGNDLGEIAREVPDDGGADEAAEEARASTQLDVDHRARREGEAEPVGVHEAAPRGEQHAGQPRNGARNGEERELVEARVVAEARHARLVLTDGDGHAPQP